MLVLKFGGTSVGSPKAIENLLRIAVNKRHAGKVSVIVVSAFSGVTDDLIRLARASLRGENGRAEKIAELRARHICCAKSFLEGAEKNSAEKDGAFAEINSSFDEISCVLESVTILKELSARTLDCIMSFGERLSARLIAHIFRSRGVDAEYLDSRLVIKTDGTFGKARVIMEETTREIKNYTGAHGSLQIAAGFIGSAPDGASTTLGRGGSDLSAAIYAAALDAEAVEIWTDVDGVMTADPKLVKNAFTIDNLSYTEAMELSHFGAKVLHPPTVLPALEKNIPIRILNTFNPEHEGTFIGSGEQQEYRWSVKGISSINSVTLVRVEGAVMAGAAGFSARLFGALCGKNINIILITQASSEHSICFAVAPEDTERAVQAIREEFLRDIESGALDEPVIEENLAIIAAVGSKMKSTSGISGRIFHALGRNNINVIAIAQGSSEINISLVISQKDTAKALNCIHEAFFLSQTRSVNLYLVGLGLIGGTLLKQIARQRETLAVQYKIKISIAGIANSRKMLFDADGIEPSEAVRLLEERGDSLNMAAFVERMKMANLPNTAFCDCTSDNGVAESYSAILNASIPVVTPNKKANSGRLDYYNKLAEIARERSVSYLYEVTVCAGLPVISTLRDLRLAGDTVRRIEAVLSGTLSFIFNNFDGSKSFSALVREAKEKGYTEPDPRDDLNAIDAARKALILARECGMPLEFSQVVIEPILPQACFEAKSVNEFWNELEKSDADFEKRRVEAAREGKTLRYVAVISEGEVKLSLRAEAEGSPFRSLTGADNIVVITSDRYMNLPMVIKGPGAGADVTAGGVFADIVRTASA
jgi:aspartokinase/homoserine dehydrogenase 1